MCPSGRDLNGRIIRVHVLGSTQSNVQAGSYSGRSVGADSVRGRGAGVGSMYADAEGPAQPSFQVGGVATRVSARLFQLPWHLPVWAAWRRARCPLLPSNNDFKLGLHFCAELVSMCVCGACLSRARETCLIAPCAVHCGVGHFAWLSFGPGRRSSRARQWFQGRAGWPRRRLHRSGAKG